MNHYALTICGLKRELPLVSLGPKLKIASFSLLGDGQLTVAAAAALTEKLSRYPVDCLVGPEVKVVPLLQEIAVGLKKPRYVVLRKKIHGYMTSPVQLSRRPTLVLNGPDAQFLEGKKVAIIDDVVSTGRSLEVARDLVRQCGGSVSIFAVILKQGKNSLPDISPLTYLGTLPVFTS